MNQVRYHELRPPKGSDALKRYRQWLDKWLLKMHTCKLLGAKGY